MPKFELEWSLTGRAVVEADDADEAEDILNDSLLSLDSTMLEEVDVYEVTVDGVSDADDEDDDGD